MDMMHDTRTAGETMTTDEQEFRNAIALAIENGASGSDLLTSAVAVYARHARHHAQQLRARDAEIGRLTAESGHQAAMLGQISATISRQTMTAAERGAHLERHRHVEQEMLRLADEVQDEAPEVAARIRAVCDYPAAGAGPARPVVVAFVPDSRWRTGWFSEPSAPAVKRAFPFAGWMLTADTARSVGQRPEAAFVVEGRPVGVGMLQEWGMTLSGLE